MVSIKHKVTIKTKTAQEETPVAVESPVVTLKRKLPEDAKDAGNSEQKKVIPTPGPEKKPNTGKVVGGIAAAAAILAGVYFFGIKGDDKSDAVAVIPPTEQVAQAGETPQSEAANQADIIEDETVTGENAVYNAPEASSPADNGEISSASGTESTDPSMSEDKQPEKAASNAPSDSKPVQQVPSKQVDTSNANIVATASSLGGDVVENAKRVIRGEFGNGQERKDKLGVAYAEIQAKVNEMYRNGQVQ